MAISLRNVCEYCSSHQSTKALQKHSVLIPPYARVWSAGTTPRTSSKAVAFSAFSEAHLLLNRALQLNYGCNIMPQMGRLVNLQIFPCIHSAWILSFILKLWTACSDWELSSACKASAFTRDECKALKCKSCSSHRKNTQLQSVRHLALTPDLRG